MNKVIQYSLFSLLALSLASSSALAAKKKSKVKKEDRRPFPWGCVPTGFKFSHFTLIVKPNAKGHKQSIFLVFNKLGQQVRLRQSITGEKPYTAHNNHQIYSKHWSALATDQNHLRYICTVKNKKKNALYDNVIDCSTALKICQFPRVKFGGNNHGNYWVGRSTAKKGITRAIHYHGILLLGPKKEEKPKQEVKPSETDTL